MNNIKALRTARDWSMEALAQRLAPPTTASTINKLEKGQRKLTEQWLRKLSTALECPVDAIIGDTTPSSVPAGVIDIETLADAIRWARKGLRSKGADPTPESEAAIIARFYDLLALGELNPPDSDESPERA